MKTLAADTAPHVEAAQIKLTRQMPAWRKLALVGQMNRALVDAGV